MPNAELLVRDHAHLIHPLHDPKAHKAGHVWVKGRRSHPHRCRWQEVSRRTVWPLERRGGLWPRGARRGGESPDGDPRLLLWVLRELQSAGDRAGRPDLPVDQPVLLHVRWRRGEREQLQDGSFVLEAAREARQDEGPLPTMGLPRCNPRRDERHRHQQLLVAVRAPSPASSTSRHRARIDTRLRQVSARASRRRTNWSGRSDEKGQKR